MKQRVYRRIMKKMDHQKRDNTLNIVIEEHEYFGGIEGLRDEARDE